MGVTTQTTATSRKSKPASSTKTTKNTSAKQAKTSKKSTGTAKAKLVVKQDQATTAETTSPFDTAQRHQFIETAAYYLAEKRGFAGDASMDDWLLAEAEIDELLKIETSQSQ